MKQKELNKLIHGDTEGRITIKTFVWGIISSLLIVITFICFTCSSSKPRKGQISSIIIFNKALSADEAKLAGQWGK